jgi:GNAT superfamily N-acetyltransferase
LRAAATSTERRGPGDQQVAVVQGVDRRGPIGHRLVVGTEGAEGLRAGRLEIGFQRLVALEIEDVVVDQGEEQSVRVEPDAAEHLARGQRAQRGQLFEHEVQIVRRDRHMPVTIRTATPADSALILPVHPRPRRVREAAGLGRGDGSRHRCERCSAKPRAFADIAEIDGAPVGFALWFYNYSTFVGRHGIYLEDLFVRPEARGSGAGKALLGISPSAASTRTWAGWNGRCWTGTRRRSPSTTAWAPPRWTSGSCAG